MPTKSVENVKLDAGISLIRFLPGRPGDLPSICFEGYEDTGFRYDPNTKSLILSFDGTDVYTFDDTGGLTTTVVTLQANGTAANPSYSFAASPGTGMYSPSANTLAFSTNGAPMLFLATNDIRLSASAPFGWSSGNPASAGLDLMLNRDGAADILALRRSTNAQTFRIYNTYTDAANNEYLSIDWTASANNAVIVTRANGTGTVRNMNVGAGTSANFNLWAGNQARWVINSTGMLLTIADNTVDIGASGANRPRNLYFGTQILAPGGNAAAPDYAWTGATNTGFFIRSAPGGLIAAEGGQTVAGFFSTGVYGVQIRSDMPLSWASTTTLGSGSDAFFWRDGAADTIGQRRGTNAQTFNIYNTFTDASNYERGAISWSSNEFNIQTQKLGTGTARDLVLGVNGSRQWRISASTGFLQPQTDVSLDFGTSSFFIKDIYVRRRIGKIATVTYSASMTPDASLGEMQEITANNGTAFTINAPSNPLTGQQMNVKISNTSGGALGAVTWNAVFKMAAWTSPATGFNRSVEFYYNGTNWIEFGRCTADIPN